MLTQILFVIQDPLEQFLVLATPFIGQFVGISNLTITYFFVFFLIILFFFIVNSEPYYFNNRYKAIFLVLVFFVKNVLKENIQVRSLIFFFREISSILFVLNPVSNYVLQFSIGGDNPEVEKGSANANKTLGTPNSPYLR